MTYNYCKDSVEFPTSPADQCASLIKWLKLAIGLLRVYQARIFSFWVVSAESSLFLVGWSCCISQHNLAREKPNLEELGGIIRPCVLLFSSLADGIEILLPRSARWVSFDGIDIMLAVFKVFGYLCIPRDIYKARYISISSHNSRMGNGCKLYSEYNVVDF